MNQRGKKKNKLKEKSTNRDFNSDWPQMIDEI